MPEAPFQPPLKPMLAELRRDLPEGDFIYEPKWGGFRCIAFVTADDVDLRSRAWPLVLDGEIVGVEDPSFEKLMLRLHPAASRALDFQQRLPLSG